MIKLLSFSGSPVQGGCTEILLRRVADAVAEHAGGGGRVEHTLVRLNDLKFIPCQACGKAPTPDYCFYEDDLTGLYESVAACDCMLFGSPIYFDSVSAQAKAFIDRCNCFRPPDFGGVDPDHRFIRLLGRKRPGGIILVGSEEGWLEGARRCIAGLFKWIEVVNEGVITYRSSDYTEVGSVVSDGPTLEKAVQLGRHLADVLAGDYAQR
ncbi:MAG TPA: flavodoxin family protein [Acidobacteriota bacterium]|nr:flavodoxin family protein [Acidobacteriota bacterium]